MSKTYFAISDIHGFYDEFITALNDAGYDKDNPDHVLIVVGDIFDRGPKNLFVYKFLKSLPKERRILIRGNHEDMFVELLGKPFPAYYDFQNKTVETFCQLSGFNEQVLLDNVIHHISSTARDYWAQIVEIVKMMRIDEWIKSDEWVEYFELGDLIFTHSFIPPHSPNWRTEATQKEWNKAHWGNPWEQYLLGLFSEEESRGKKIVFGHWHTYDIRTQINNLTMMSRDYSIFEHKGFIALDSGVFLREGKLQHPTNVLVIKDGQYTKHHINNMPEQKYPTRVYTTNVE